MNDRIWLSPPHMSLNKLEIDYMLDAMAKNWVAPLGENVNGFEKDVRERIGRSQATALISGTSAIHLALKAAGVTDGQIVLCQSLTFSGSANPIRYVQATPVFIDSSLETWNMDLDYLEEALKTYDNIGAVLSVDIYGLGNDYERMEALCKKYGVPLIEDAAEALGSRYNGRPAGSFGDYSIISFNGNKILTTSGGGVLLHDNAEMDQRIRYWATQARDPAPYYEHSEIGYNYRLSNITAGIGRGQMTVLDERLAQKKFIYNYYKEHLQDLEGIRFMPEIPHHEPNYWLTCMVLESHVTPAEVIAALEKGNIESRRIWKPMHLQPVFKGCDYVGGTVAQTLFEKGVCLPSGTAMSEEDLARIVGIIRSLWS
ncbi:4-keto-6-deoxy-N-Acetyl-D-hexosaminyl-(Lipid carrier) aminotransferase [Clostridiaceae bacterium JG1575]|nr:4-keto-6-deoxy-N-Acetyl-D-hexosaminyl-(Lipid carrier) aminotransferase [Clostridiaceae bacterium JG1575]